MALENTAVKSFDVRIVLLILTVVLLSMLETLDTTITNVALPVIMGNMSVPINTVTWVSTGYIIGSAVIMPAVGALIKKYGQKRLLIISVLGFIICSLFCGMEDHFILMVCFRILQGMFGASLVPLSQYIIMGKVDKKLYPIVLGIWGFGILLAANLGPILGGLIILHLGWRWIFFVNIPVGTMALIFALFLVEESKVEAQNFDVKGLVLLVVFVGCIQFLIARGGALGWFHSKAVFYLIIISLVGITLFCRHALKTKEACIINFGLFVHRKFLFSTLNIGILSGVIFGVSAILPLFLEKMMGYTSLNVGMAVSVNIFGAVTGMLIAMLVVKFVDARWIMIVGLACVFLSILALSNLTLSIVPFWVGKILIVRSFGFGLFFVPIASIAFMELPENLMAMGTGVFNFSRNIGASVGIALASGNLSSLAQISWNHLVGNISPFAQGFQFWLTRQELVPNLTYNNPIAAYLSLMELVKQSYVKAYSEIFFIFAVLSLLCIPLVISLGKCRLKNLSMGG